MIEQIEFRRILNQAYIDVTQCMVAEILRRGILDVQVCVPKDWSDEKVIEFTEQENPCGTSHGWYIRKQGDPALAGCDERVQCEECADNCHIMLDA